MKDILFYISDQHSWLQQGYAGDEIVRTPNLDRLASEGTVMQNNYTSYPLCVPARMSLMSGQLASKCGVMGNFVALDSNRATFAHSLASVGYETVLCGRMHFVGPDQRHGFTKRIAGEMTPIYHNRPMEAFKQERGVHVNTPTGSAAALKIIGGGNSPTLEYDRYVVENALEYLEQDHEKPQFICVGTYGPHHPYVAPKELYEYYYDKVTLPENTYDLPEHPALDGKMLCDTDPEVVRAVRASYYGMVEFEDMKIGAVYDAFQDYLKRTGHEGVFIYVSDHGDHIGYRGYYGKNSFYEASSHTPMLFVGDGIERGKIINGATTLMDIGPTVCDIVGAPIAPGCDGVSLFPQLSGDEDNTERMVISELGGEYRRGENEVFYGQMVKYKNLKFIRYHGYEEEQMFDVENDPLETENVISKYPELANKMRSLLDERCRSYDEIVRHADELRQSLPIMAKCDFDSEERWHAPEAARDYPEYMVSSKLEMPGFLKMK